MHQPPTAPQARTAPSAFNSNGSGISPSVAVLHYDPRPGRYVAPDGQMYRQADLAGVKVPKTWEDLLISQADSGNIELRAPRSSRRNRLWSSLSRKGLPAPKFGTFQEQIDTSLSR
jgi:hypothetical protein